MRFDQTEREGGGETRRSFNFGILVRNQAILPQCAGSRGHGIGVVFCGCRNLPKSGRNRLGIGHFAVMLEQSGRGVNHWNVGCGKTSHFSTNSGISALIRSQVAVCICHSFGLNGVFGLKYGDSLAFSR